MKYPEIQMPHTSVGPSFIRCTIEGNVLQASCRAAKDIPRHAACTANSLPTQLPVRSCLQGLHYCLEGARFRKKLIAFALCSCSSKNTGVNLKYMCINLPEI